MVSHAPTPAPQQLETVRQFVNTRDIEAGTDALSTAEGLRAWASDTSGMGVPVEPSPADLRRTRELREALRAALLTNHDHGQMPGDAVAALNSLTRRGAIALEFHPDASWTLTPQLSGVDEVLGRIVTVVASAMTDGTWRRLKVCSRDSCRWAFYDASRARTAKWCSMQLCGNRAKQEAWRSRQDSARA
jgi:predicted RNA-binding Zn ribbon-like protein